MIADSPVSPRRAGGTARLAVGLGVAALPFAAYSAFILNHFYRFGALLNDSGYIAHMMWRGGPALRVGRAVLDNQSFFAFHVTPLFTLTSFLGGFVPLAMPQLFAAFVGLSHALLAVGVFWILTGPYGMRSAARMAVVAALAVGFGFDGAALAMVKFPHFEILIPASFILFLIAWSQGRLVLAGVFFAICLATREDAGFQICALLAVLAMLDRWNGIRGRLENGTLIFLVAGFVYSVAVVLVQRIEFPVRPLLTANYIGDPPFAHLTWQLVLVRFFGYFLFRTYIVLPALCAIGWAVAAKNPYIVVGYVAFIPWTLLQLLSVNDAIGTIPYHYGYPYLVASFWPLIGVLLSSRRTGRPINVRGTVIGFAVVVAASFVGVSRQANPSGADLLPSFTSIPSFTEQSAVEHAILVLRSARAELGRIAAEDGVAALATDDYAESETFWPDTPERPDTVLYFPDGYRADAARQLIASAGLDRVYAIAGTPILVATDRPLSSMPILAPLLVPIPRPAEK
jgi:hypothetical protein